MLRSALRPGEHVAGLGERAAPLDLRGGRYRLWNRDPGGAWGPGSDPLYCGIPVLVGMHRDADVLVFHDNSHYGVVAIDGSGGRPVGSGVVEVRLAGGMARHYVSTGTLPQLLERYAALTGLPRLPPRWALGYQHCRWGYRSQEEIEAVSAGFEREGVPLSALYLDIDYMEGYRVFTVDPARFADLPAMCAHLEMRGTRLVTIVDPGVKVDQSYPVYREGLEAGHFVRDADGQPVIGVVWPGRSAFPDFTSPRTRDWWARWYARLLDAGVTGLWHDMNEPTSIALAGDPTLPRSTPHDLEGRGGTHLEAHNVYGLDMDRAGWEGARRARPDRRPFVVSRAGWAGVQRWAWIWTGDAESTWHGLRQQVATALGLGLSGVPFTGSDIGGFSGDPGPELYVRWLELSMFVPFCRTHSVVGAPGREPWRFAAPYREIIGRLIRARYRLLPYLYTVAWEASETGHPVMRPLYWNPAGSSPAPDVDPPDDRADDQFLVGDDLLVAPVTAPGRDSRRVWLPAGAWYPWDAAGGAEVVSPRDRRPRSPEAPSWTEPRPSGRRPSTCAPGPSFPSTTAGGRPEPANPQPSRTTTAPWRPPSTAGSTGRVVPAACATTTPVTARVRGASIASSSNRRPEGHRQPGRRRERTQADPVRRGRPEASCCAGSRTARSRHPSRPGWSCTGRPCTRRRSTGSGCRSWPIPAEAGPSSAAEASVRPGSRRICRWAPSSPGLAPVTGSRRDGLGAAVQVTSLRKVEK